MNAPAGIASQDSAAAGDEAEYMFSRELVTVWPSPAAQVGAIRELGALIMAQYVDLGRRGVVLCGASRGVGVSFVAANAAVALAQLGVSTILIDANLHNPRIHEMIAPREPSLGLEQLLRSVDRNRFDVIHSHVLPDLSVIFAGGTAQDAAELIDGDAFQELIDHCLRDFQFTIVDTPAANRWADARRVCKAVGYGLIVARQDESYVGDVATLSRELADDGSVVVGALLNGA